LRDYLAEVARVRATGAGTGETSYYGALQGALNAIGSELRPAVYALSQLSGGTAGFPDFGLFAEAQFARGGHPTNWSSGAIPERGVVEADDVPAPLSVKRSSSQVDGYLNAYGLVLITNYRDFELLEPGSGGAPTVVEHFSFGRDVNEFFSWAAARRGADDEAIGVSFAEFLARTLARRAPLATPRDVAALLASYAREGLARISANSSLPSLSTLREALGQSLGLTFQENEKGEHFFRSTLVQTLFYGLFSAWATHARSSPAPFDWRTSQWSLHVPAVSALFEQVATPGQLGVLGLVELLEWAADALNRVDRSAFFSAFSQADAIQHFYEPFLQAYDPTLRRSLGVWYTPPEVVEYMVERVDRALRDELGLQSGFADPSVYVLDPCTGTGSYLLAVLQRIRRTLSDQGVGAALGAELKQAATQRIAGFEVLPAPFVVAHWQVGTFLADAGAALDASTGERAAVYLTNALTGWDQGSAGSHLPFPELERERDLANAVKQVQPVLVVLGNPPYSAFEGTTTEEEGDLVAPYKEALRERWNVKKYNLDDLYVRFFRIAERRIAEMTGRGVICLITNASYLTYRSFTVMRERLVGAFDKITVDALNGDSRQTGKLTPEGQPDPSIFSTAMNPEGIRVGTAIATLVRRDNSTPKTADVSYREFWGTQKREELLESLKVPAAQFEASFAASAPAEENFFKLAPDAAAAIYRAWPSLSELSINNDYSGALEMRKGALMSHDRAELETRMQGYLESTKTFDDVRAEGYALATPAAAYDPRRARNDLIAAGGLSAGRYVQMAIYPFDLRWVFHTDVGSVWNRSRPGIAAEHAAGARFVVTRVQARKPDEGYPVYATAELPGYHLLDPNSRPFPTTLHDQAANQGGLALHGTQVRPNLSGRALEYLADLGLDNWAQPDDPQNDGVWMSALAVTYSPAWLEENADSILGDWPRVPLPQQPRALAVSANLGRLVARLLDPAVPVAGVTEGTIRPVLREIASLHSLSNAAPSPADFVATERWGARDARGAVMPGPGRTTERDYSIDEPLSSEESSCLGDRTFDVFLNSDLCWRNVPREVWDFTIGGYQVLKKWLSYRAQAVLERPLSLAEVNHFRDTARRIAAILLLGPRLDRNYRRCANDSYSWRIMADPAAEDAAPGGGT
jgi:hypothetical protein